MTLRGNESGFSLIELVLVIMILSVALLPLITQTIQATVHGADGQVVSTAAFLARERMEQVETDEGSTVVGYAGVTNARYPDESSIPGFPGYTRIVRVSADSTFSGQTFKSVKVTATAPNGQAVTLATWVVQ